MGTLGFLSFRARRRGRRIRGERRESGTRRGLYGGTRSVEVLVIDEQIPNLTLLYTDDTNTSISISEERNLNVDIDPLKVEQVAEQVDTDSEWEEVLLPPTPKMSYASVLKENQIFE